MSRALFNIAFTCAAPPTKYTGKWRAEYIANRQFHNMTADYNILKYMLDEKKVLKNKDALDYYTQSGENTGLFNLEGKMDEKQIERLQAKISTSESIIWHGFISFDEETTKGFDTQEKAIKFLKQSFSGFIKNTHLDPSNVELFAALHTDTSNHHHIHFSFFEKEANHRDKYGKLSYTKKGKINDYVVDNYVVSANMHLEENKDEYYTARDRAMEKLRAIKLSNAKAKEQADLKRNLSILASKLPSTGRLQYNSSNMANYRKEIDTIANLLIRSNPEALLAHKEMQRQFAIKEEQVIKLIKDNKLAYKNGKRLSARDVKAITEDGKKELPDKYIDLDRINYVKMLRNEYASRTGNYILGLCRLMQDEPRQERRAGVNNKHHKIAARRKRRRIDNIFYNTIKALDSYQRGVQADFTKTLHQIEREIEMQKAN